MTVDIAQAQAALNSLVPAFVGTSKAYTKSKQAIDAQLSARGIPRQSIDKIMQAITRAAYSAGATGNYGAVQLSPQEVEAARSIVGLLPLQVQAGAQQIIDAGGVGQTNAGQSFYGDKLPAVLRGEYNGVQLAPNPNGGSPIVATNQSVTNPSDPFASFRAAYNASPQAQAYGPLTDAMLTDDEFLYQMPNELFQLIPLDRLIASPKLYEERFDANGVSSRRLDSMPNEYLEQLIRANPNMIGKITMQRAAKLNRPFIDSVVQPFLDSDPQRKALLGDTLRREVANLGGGTTNNPYDQLPGTNGPTTVGADTLAGGPPTTTGGGTTTPTGTTTTTTPTGGGVNAPLSALLGNVPFGQIADTSGLNAQQMQGFFNPKVNPGYAANLAQAFGVQSDTGNPFGEFLTGTAGNLQDMSAIYRTFAGADPTAGPKGSEGSELTRQVVQDVLGQLGSGATSAVNAQEGRSFLESMSNLFKGIGAGTVKPTTGQGQLMDRLQNFGSAYDIVDQLMGGGLSPLLGTNSASARQAAQRRFANFSVTNPSVSALDFLRGAY